MKLIKEIKSKSGETHFKRWQLLKTPWFSIYIHGIYKEDQDKHLHNHPWKIWTIILWGGYFEKIYRDEYKLRKPGHMSYSNRSKFHKIEEMYKSPTYSLAIVGRRNEEWGYMFNKRFVDHKTYRKNKNKI